MKTAIIVHGMPTKEEYEKAPNQAEQHWFPWLKERLKAKKIATTIPEMPTPYAPVYEQWKDIFERIPRTEETVLVGHSGGCGFILRWISEQTSRAGKVILVAPWIDPDHLDPEHMTDFFDFKLDPSILAKTDGITIFISNDDDASILRTVEEIEKHISGTQIVRMEDKGHFTVEDGVTEFPQLLEVIEK